MDTLRAVFDHLSLSLILLAVYWLVVYKMPSVRRKKPTTLSKDSNSQNSNIQGDSNPIKPVDSFVSPKQVNNNENEHNIQKQTKRENNKPSPRIFFKQIYSLIPYEEGERNDNNQTQNFKKIYKIIPSQIRHKLSIGRSNKSCQPEVKRTVG
jgi:hypothetical protein